MGQHDRDLELDDRGRFGEREATAERVGWLVMVLVLVAAALGLFGNGPISHRRSSSDDLTVRYQRFARSQGNTSVEVEARAAGSAGTVDVWMAEDFLDAYDVETVQPPPRSTSTRAGGVVFSFATEGGAAVKVTFTLQPEDVGRQHGAVAVGDGRPATFTQFVYP